MPSAAITPRCSCPVLIEAHSLPHAHRRARVPLPCHLRPSSPLPQLQLRTQRSRKCVFRAINSSLESATAPPDSLDQQPSPTDSSAADGDGASVKSDGKVMVTFRWPAALGGRDVSVVGSFNGWTEQLTLSQSPETKDFVRSVAIEPGTIHFKYIVDGSWTTSPCESVAHDSQGQMNHQRLISASVDFLWRASWGGPAQQVYVTGDFAGWVELLPLQRNPVTGDFSLKCSLQPGVYYVQFLVDGAWMSSPDLPVGPDEDGHFCNKISVQSPPAFHIFYATGWLAATLSCRVLHSDGTPHHSGWQQLPMTATASRAQPGAGIWRAAVVPVPADLITAAAAARPARGGGVGSISGGGGSTRLEFVVTDGRGNEDKPPNGAAYSCASPGGFRLEGGRLLPFPSARQPPSMLVSDLDGTMVGDGPEADAATAAFQSYWEANAALCGSVLVYNTGRSLGQFVSLIEEKGGRLALPDVLITAVGTKIFLLDSQSRGSASTSAWREDRQWAARLDHGWDLSVARQVVEHVLGGLQAEDAGAWLDQGTEHPHRLAISVRQDRVPAARLQLSEAFAARSLQVRIIVSGVGSWRYVDCVAIRAGKLEALEYVRQLFGVPLDRCVAAGDSGNDILMLEGRNLAICVGNSQPALLEWAMQQPQTPRVITTDAHMARGVLEGFCRHGLF